ncbi:MAG: hypothetical protein WD382_01525 [Halofilum sp. (in: g-proteobacteria)]
MQFIESGLEPMAERLIARYKHEHISGRPLGLEPDSGAPSVDEICRVLRQARGWCPQGQHPTRQRITELIARLER